VRKSDAYVAVVACLTGLTVLHAGPPASVQDRPTFKSGIQYIEIDVTVLDQKGRLVRGLTLDDFELFEDNLQQKIEDFRLVDIPIPPRRPRDTPRSSLVERDVTTNTASGRIYVMLLESTPAFPFAHTYLTQRVARWFVEQALGPDDLMAVIHVQGSSAAAQSFTNSRERLLESIDRLALPGWGHDPSVDEPSRRVGTRLGTWDTVRYVSETLGSIGNQRKAILWIGGFAPFHHTDPAEAVAYRDAVRAANRNNVAIYPIDPEGLTITLGRGELERLGALRAIAEDTGGDAIVNTNNFSGGYGRIVEQNSTYYVLGYYPAMEHDDGRFHDIKVRVKQKGLTVRSRKGYVAPTAQSRATAPRAPVPEGLTPESIEGLRRVVPLGDMGLEMFLAPFRSADGKGSVLLGARLRGADLELDAEDRIEVSHLAIDSIGTIRPGMRRTFTLNLRPDTRHQVEALGFRYFDRLDLPPGRHEVRLVVHQPAGSTGSVVAHVDVPDFGKTPLTMSGLVLASLNDVTHRTLVGDDIALRALMTDPTVSRRFTSDDVLTIWAEAYDSRKALDAQLRLSTRITPESGGDTLMARERLLTAAAGEDRQRFVHQDRITLSGLPSGSYVLTVEARTMDGKHVSTRHVPFTITGN
jgi:VWFA-related protein